VIRVGVIGYGYWGVRLARNFATAQGSRLTTIVDLDARRQALAARNHPGTEVMSDHRDMLRNGDVDLVAIATPLSSHYPLAMAALDAGRHVLVEKPLAATADEALRLIDAAERSGLTLMVDHTFLYTEAVRKIHELVQSGTLGDIYYFDSVRVNLGLFQHDTNIVYDLAVHDLAVMDYVLAKAPSVVSATGARHFDGQAEDVAFLTLFFEDSALISHVHVNWLAPVKVRRTLIGGDRKMIVFDDLDPSEKVKVYDKGVEFVDDPAHIDKMLISYRVGDIWVPNLEIREALQTMVKELLDCVTTGTPPVSDGRMGLRVVRSLEAATQSMAERGRPVEIVQE